MTNGGGEHAAAERLASLEAAGLFLAAYAESMTQLRSCPDVAIFREAAVRTLALAGATAPALRLATRYRLLGEASLLARVAATTGRRQDVAAAAAAYYSLWRLAGERRDGCDAAVLSRACGDGTRSDVIAAAIGGLPDDGGVIAAGCAAEAALLQGNLRDAQHWIGRAAARTQGDLDARAGLRHRLRRALDACGNGGDGGGGGEALLDALPMPGTVHFCGRIPDVERDEAAARRAVDAAIAGVGFGFGSLAAGADLLIAEALLARGAGVTAVLPFPPAAFVERSVRPAGASWVPRFWACLARSTVRVLADAPVDDLDYALASRRAMGLARRHAADLDGDVRQLAMWDAAGNGGDVGPVGTAADVALWRRTGRTEVIACPWPRRRRAVDDAPGAPMRELAATAATRRDGGDDDAVTLRAFDDADAAVAFALARDRVADVPAQACVALDFGPAPSRAADVVSALPLAMTVVTEGLADELALSPSRSVACDYAGRVIAGPSGIVPIFTLRRQSASAAWRVLRAPTAAGPRPRA